MSKQETISRAVPYRAPDANHHQPAPVRASSPTRQLLLMGGFCVLFLFAGLGVGLFAMKGNAPRQDQGERNKDNVPNPNQTRKSGPEQDDTLSAGRDAPVVPTLAKDSTGQMRDVPRLEVPASGFQGGKMTSQPGTPPAVPEAVVEAIGGLAASHLYQTYLNIGLLADSVEGEVYEKDEARRLLDTVAGLTTAVEQQLDRVGRQTLKGDEKKALEQARLVTASLRTQMRELQSYWEKDDKDHVTRFHQARQDTWAGIKLLLNIQE